MTADIFSECFAGATPGTITQVSFGPLNGWTFKNPLGLGAQTSEITFAPSLVTMRTQGVQDYPVMAKQFPQLFTSVLSISGMFTFTEFANITPDDNTWYLLILTGLGFSDNFAIWFRENNVRAFVGSTVNMPRYDGVWTPSPGTRHEVFYQVSALGIPRIWLDGTEITLALFGPVAGPWAAYQDMSVHLAARSGDAGDVTAEFENVFVANGLLAPTTRFCCP